MISTLKAKSYAVAVMIALLLGIVQSASAGPFDDGLDAATRGDFATALKLWRPLANQGNAEAQALLGWIYHDGQGVAPDYAEAMKWYRLAANQGNAQAQFNLGVMYRNGQGVAQNYVEALKWCRLAANQGNALAQHVLGAMYSDGQGVAQDYTEALKWYRLAANQGNAKAQLSLGLRYMEGQGVAQDYAEAAKWYRLAANNGEAKAQLLLGTMYTEGQGVAQDYAEAAKWHRLAANQGEADAQYGLGVMYVEGNGVAQDYVEAHKWFNRAANQGKARAQFNLGVMYLSGKGVPQDYVEAHKWFNLAGVGGIENAATQRGNVENKMTREQIAQAQKMANICRTSNYKQCGEPELSEAVTGTPSAPTTSARKSGSTNSSAIAIPLQKQGGTFVVLVLINNAITLEFVIDSGAADVSIPADVVRTLMRTGTLKQTDFLGEKTYVLADGSTVPSQTFRIRSMKVGDRIVENVTGRMAPEQGSLLLGQSFFVRFKSWSIDNSQQVLLLE